MLSLMIKNSNLSSKMTYCFPNYSPLWSINFWMRSIISWAFVCTNRLLHLFELLSNYVVSNENKFFFTAKCLCNILYMLVELMPKFDSISQYVTWRSCIICFCTALMFSGPTTDFGRYPRNSSMIEWLPRLNSLYQSFTVA